MLAQNENVNFSFHLEAGPYLIRAEKFHLENVIENLLENAKKYADDPVIALKTYIKRNKLFIAVSDNGQGIAKEDQKKIFRKYYRVKNGNIHKVKGYGLGLAYVQKIVKMHRGTISVDSEPGKGTTFTIALKMMNNG